MGRSSAIGVLLRDDVWHTRYSPDMQEKATQLVLEQAEVLSGEWALAQIARARRQWWFEACFELPKRKAPL
jgi:hypothetical protein